MDLEYSRVSYLVYESIIKGFFSSSRKFSKGDPVSSLTSSILILEALNRLTDTDESIGTLIVKDLKHLQVVNGRFRQGDC